MPRITSAADESNRGARAILCYKPLVPSLWLYVLLAIVIESEPADSSLLEWALQSCTEALVDERCVGHEASGEGARYRAHIRWNDPLHAQIALRREDAERSLVGERDVEFTALDPPHERYRALGLIAAAWVLAERPLPAAHSEDSKVPPTPLPPWPRLALDLAAVGGPALDQGSWRAGGAVRARLPLSRGVPWLGLAMGARATHRPRDEPLLTWAGASLGVSGRVPLHPRLALESRLEAVGQLLFARAGDPAGDGRQRKRKERLGGQLGLELYLRVLPRLSLFVGGEAARFRPRTSFTFASSPVGRERTVEVSLIAGLRIAL